MTRRAPRAALLLPRGTRPPSEPSRRRPLGVFNGTLILPDKRNLSLVLLEAGLASRFGAAADRSVHAADLAKSEGVAKAAGLKVWADYSEEAAAEEVAANAANASEMEPIPDAHKQRVELTLTEIAAGAHFHAHVAGDDTVARLHAKRPRAPARRPRWPSSQRWARSARRASRRTTSGTAQR